MRKFYDKLYLLSPKKKIIINSLVGVFLSMIIVITIIESLNTEAVDLKGTISRDSSTFVVTERTSDIKGLEFTVLEDSYQDNTLFSLSNSPVGALNLPEHVSTISTIIDLSIDEGYSSKPLTVSIPIDIDTEREYAMAFYINGNNFEAIPSVELSNKLIKIQAKHFEEFIILKIDKGILNTTDVDSKFKPGIDDWQFPNNGSILAPNGHCAGQSITSLYYYIKHAKLGEPNLHNLYNNNTENQFFDDREGIRFSSVIQNKVDFTSNEFNDLIDFSNNDSNAYYQFLFSIYMSDNPQFMAIYSHNEQGELVSGHAMIAYKIIDNQLFIADPNFPGNDTRYIEYNNNTFTDYNSGDSFQQIINKGVISYDTFVFVGLSAFIDFNILEYDYKKVLDKTIGNFEMPTLNVEYLKTYSYNTLEIEWESTNRDIFIKSTYNLTVPTNMKDKFVFRGTIERTDAQYRLFIDGEYISSIVPESNGYFYASSRLLNGSNDVGILVEVVANGVSYYVDYWSFSYTYEGETKEVGDPQDEIVGAYHYSHTMPAIDYLNRTHNFIIINDGTFVEFYSYLNSDSQIFGSWTLSNVDGQYFLTLTSDNLVRTFSVSESFQTITYVDDNKVDYFYK